MYRSTRIFHLAARSVAVAAGACFPAVVAVCEEDVSIGVSYETKQVVTNWSSTHTASPARVYEPKSAQECIRVLQRFHEKKQKIRPMGTALSPNGIGLPSPSSKKSDSDDDDECLLSLAGLDHVQVDVANKQVTVGAGAHVSSVLSELKKHGLTLSNFSSIQEQQMGGWTQVSAHGTGITLPPVDEMIIKLQLATPTEGLMTLSKTASPVLFDVAKVGLGSVGVVTEMTLSCVPRMSLKETSFVSSRSEIGLAHRNRLCENRHVRYMWIPYSDSVVGVVSNPVPSLLVDEESTSSGVVANHADFLTPAQKSAALWGDEAAMQKADDEALQLAIAESLRTFALEEARRASLQRPTQPLCDLLLSLQPQLERSKIELLGFSQLRDLLLDMAPLELEHVKAVNAAEALFWKASIGERIDDSTNILGFDCGGEQWVFEMCFPIGAIEPTLEDASTSTALTKDIVFVQRLLAIVEEAGMPAPSPIEQRWSARSRAIMSPAYSTDDKEVFSWVGVIMYMPPSQTKAQRAEIGRKFTRYCELLQPLMDEYKATVHWAKIELPQQADPNYQEKIEAMRKQIAAKHNVPLFNKFRRALDPHSILTNKLIDELLSPSIEVSKGE